MENRPAIDKVFEAASIPDQRFARAKGLGRPAMHTGRKQAVGAQHIARSGEPQNYLASTGSQLSYFDKARGEQNDVLDRVALSKQHLPPSELLFTRRHEDAFTLDR